MHPSLLFLEVDPEDEPLIRSRFPDATIVHSALNDDALIEAAQSATIICGFIYSAFPQRVLAQLPHLRLLLTRSVGYDHIDLNACSSQGIAVCHVPDYGSHVIAEHVFALLLSTIRHVSEAGEQVRHGHFDYHGLRGMALMGKTIGILGTGKIGMNTAKIAAGFGMRILAVDRCRVLELEEKYGVHYVDLDTALRQSDVISLHLPVLPDTRHLLSTPAFSLMKDGVIIVNTARGELIDTEALLVALKSGKVSHALLDVLEDEQNYASNQELIRHPHVLVTPHIAFYADDSMQRMYTDSFHSIDQWTSGTLLDHAVQQKLIVCDLPGVRQSPTSS